MSVCRRFGADEKPHCCVTRFALVSDAFESDLALFIGGADSIGRGDHRAGLKSLFVLLRLVFISRMSKRAPAPLSSPHPHVSQPERRVALPPSNVE
jgi:hypothetical protein